MIHPVREVDENLIAEAKALKTKFPDTFGFNVLKRELRLCTRVTNELLAALKQGANHAK